jgi:hypothetical protein
MASERDEPPAPVEDVEAASLDELECCERGQVVATGAGQDGVYRDETRVGWSKVKDRSWYER